MNSTLAFPRSNFLSGVFAVSENKDEDQSKASSIPAIPSMLMRLLEAAIIGTIIAVMVSWATVQRLESQARDTLVVDKEQEQRLRSLEMQSGQHSSQLIALQQKLADIMQQQVDISRRQEEALKGLNERMRDAERASALRK